MLKILKRFLIKKREKEEVVVITQAEEMMITEDLETEVQETEDLVIDNQEIEVMETEGTMMIEAQIEENVILIQTIIRSIVIKVKVVLEKQQMVIQNRARKRLWESTEI